jgi:hypothetical protein
MSGLPVEERRGKDEVSGKPWDEEKCSLRVVAKCSQQLKAFEKL